mgnify:CR=1 FL=1
MSIIGAEISSIWSIQMCGDGHRMWSSEGIDISSPSLMTTLNIPRCAWSRRRTKFSPASWRWNGLLNRRKDKISSASSSMVGKSIFPTSSLVICKRKEFGVNSPTNTRRSRMVWPTVRTRQSKKQSRQCSRRRACWSFTRLKPSGRFYTFKIGPLL